MLGIVAIATIIDLPFVVTIILRSIQGTGKIASFARDHS